MLWVSLQEGTNACLLGTKHEVVLNADIKTDSEQQQIKKKKEEYYIVSEYAKYSISASFPTFYYSLLRLVARVFDMYFCVVYSVWHFTRRFPWTLQTLAEDQAEICF